MRVPTRRILSLSISHFFHETSTVQSSMWRSISFAILLEWAPLISRPSTMQVAAVSEPRKFAVLPLQEKNIQPLEINVQSQLRAFTEIPSAYTVHTETNCYADWLTQSLETCKIQARLILVASESPYQTVAIIDMAFRWMAIAWALENFLLILFISSDISSTSLYFLPSFVSDW